LVRSYKRRRSDVRLWSWLKNETKPALTEALAVALPMAAIAVILLAGYESYHFSTEKLSVYRLEKGADLLERAGDYKAGAYFRQRAFALSWNARRDYFYRRDLWLVKFTQSHRADPVDLLNGLDGIERVYGNGDTDYEHDDGELRAAAIYLHWRYE